MFHFDLSDQYAAQASYGIAKSQIQRCRELNLESFHLIGFITKQTANPIAQEWLQKFRDEENLGLSTLICDTSPSSIENLRQYIRQLILQSCERFELENDSLPEMDSGEIGENIDNGPGCLLC